jgi:hypothetical protein
MNLKAGLITFGLKALMFLFALILMAFGYYGYIYVPSKSVGPFGPPCPFGREGTTTFWGFEYGSGPCRYSRLSLMIGLGIIIILVILAMLPGKKKK